MRESLFRASIRSMLIVFFGMIGFFLGLFFLLIMFGAFSVSSSSTELETHYRPEIVANAEGKRKVLSSNAPVLLKLNISGVIGTESLTTHAIQQQLVESREGDFENNRVKAILLHINSPGGTVIDSDGIYRAIKNYKDQYKLPVYAFVDGLCASGGMYIACAADKIYASDSSVIGSVGVLMPTFMNFTQLLEKIGVETMTLKAGKGKDDMNPLRPWKPGEEETMQQLINYFYDDFVSIVVANRPIDKEKLINDYGAKIFNPKQAQEIGYINVAGANLKQAMKDLLKEIDIEDDYYQVIEMQKKNWYNTLFSSESSLLQGKVIHQLALPSEMDPKLMNQFLYLYRP